MNLVLASVEQSGLSFTWLVFLLIAYFIPSLVVWGRKVPNPWSVVVINVFLGWTLIGWVVALAMAARSEIVSDVPGTRE